MFVGRNIYNVTCNFRLNGDPITVVNDSKDLGVIVDNCSKFQTHVNGIVAKAHARANLIHRCFVAKDTCTLIKVFQTCSAPTGIFYCSYVWSP